MYEDTVWDGSTSGALRRLLLLPQEMGDGKADGAKGVLAEELRSVPEEGSTSDMGTEAESKREEKREKGVAGQMTIKESFRRVVGYDESHRCKQCKHLRKVNVGQRTAYKCEVMGISNSSATDIRLKDYACERFVPRARLADYLK